MSFSEGPSDMFSSRQVDQYAKCYIHDGHEEIEKFDIILYLSQLEDSCNSITQPLMTCLREPLCDCKEDEQGNVICDCDHDEVSLVKKISFNMMSNCMYHFTLSLDNRLYPVKQSKKPKKSKTGPKQEDLDEGKEDCTIRIFALNCETLHETPWFDIDKFNNKVVFYQDPRLEFDLDEEPTHHGHQVEFKVNYMHYTIQGIHRPRCNDANEQDSNSESNKDKDSDTDVDLDFNDLDNLRSGI